MNIYIYIIFIYGLKFFNTVEHGESKCFFCTKWYLPLGSWILLETWMVWAPTPRKKPLEFLPRFDSFSSRIMVISSLWRNGSSIKHMTRIEHIKIFSAAIVQDCASCAMIPGLRLLAVESHQHLHPNVACPVDARECEPLLDLQGLAVNRSKEVGKQQEESFELQTAGRGQ